MHQFQQLVIGHDTAVLARILIVGILHRGIFECNGSAAYFIGQAVEEAPPLRQFVGRIDRPQQNVPAPVPVAVLLDELDDMESVLGLHHLRYLTGLQLFERIRKGLYELIQRHLHSPPCMAVPGSTEYILANKSKRVPLMTRSLMSSSSSRTRCFASLLEVG